MRMWSTGVWGTALLVLLLFSSCRSPHDADPQTGPTDTVQHDSAVPASISDASPADSIVSTAPATSRSLPVDPSLQKRLERAVRSRASWSALIDQKAFALGVVDLSDLSRPRYAAIHGEEMMYAASLPKIGILLAAMHQMETGRLPASSAVTEDLNAMIRVSSNEAATRMIDRVGGLQAINDVLTDPRYRFYDPEQGGGLWVGKRYADDGRRVPDPMENLSHAATPYQVCRFYTLLAQRRLITEARSEQMLAILADPGLSHKFVAPLEERAPDAEIHRKSGSWRQWHSDSALVWGPDRRYVVVALVRDRRGERVVRSVIPVVEQVLGIQETESAHTP